MDGHSLRVLGALFALLVVTTYTAGSPATAGTTASLDDNLVAALAAADPTDELVVIATTATVPDVTLVATLEATGVVVVPFTRLPAAALQGTPAEIELAGTVTGVEGLWLNTPLQTALAQSRAVIQADEVYAEPLGYTGAGVGVAVLDSGIEATHPDLEYPSKTIQNVKVLGNQHVFEDLTFTVEDVPDTDTTTGHGTHVAGIVAGDGTASEGLYHGVAPGAPLIGIGAADGVEMLTAMAGYDWILAHHEQYGIRVINNSWADGSIEYDPDHPLNVASKAAHDAGIVVVFAAGNDGQDSGNVFNRYAYPDWVISVGGGTKTGQLADYSSRGDADHHADLIAPGSFIASTMATTGIVGVPNQSPFDFTNPLAPRMIAPEHMPYYTVKLGTSMAAPHVAGVVALMLEANPDLTPAQVRQILIATATPMPSCPVIDCGAGYVNALGAVKGALAAAATPPTARLVATPTSGAAPLEVTLDASGSTDQDGVVVAYRWDLDGDAVSDLETTTATLVHTYASGVHRPTLTVVDDGGLASAPVQVEIRASDPPVASVDAPRHAKSGHAATFDASGSFDPDGAVTSYRFVFGDGTEMTTDSPIVTHTYETAHPVRLGWMVEVTDDAGLRDAVTGSVRVTPHGG
ncbi:MAG: S8 family serine peptidase [Nitriliruptorales bacterium]|nr:S8 family serine peptidase [Nitriliruptorales bacterium]